MHFGYKLIRVEDAAELQSWGGVWGQCPGFPNPLILPNGDQIHAGAPGVDYGGYRVDLWTGGPSVANVKAEAQRRIVVLTGAVDFNGCMVKQMNALMLAIEIVNKKASGGTLTPDEEATAAALTGMAGSIRDIRVASNVIEALGEIPLDYAADARWA